MKRIVAENGWPNAKPSSLSSVPPRRSRFWFPQKLRPVDRDVKRTLKIVRIRVKKNPRTSLTIAFHRFTPASPKPLFHRKSAVNPPLSRSYSTRDSADFPRIFRMFCTCVDRDFFRSFCAAISQENSGRDRKKNGSNSGGGPSCGKRAARRSPVDRPGVFNVAHL